MLLRVGIVRSKRAPTKMHPYGYMKDKFVWSLVSAVGIFCLGAGVTCAHGFSNLLAPPQHLEHLGYGLAVERRQDGACGRDGLGVFVPLVRSTGDLVAQ